MKTDFSKYESDPKFWEYYRNERDRLERIDRTLSRCRPVPMSIQEIADVIGEPYETVRTILRRAMAKMKKRVNMIQLEAFL